MRLLTEYMSVPEVNGVVSDKSFVDKKPGLAAKEPESAENRNLQLARQVDEQKTKLINALSKFPIAALWVINKYEQQCDKVDQEDSAAVPTEFDSFLKDVKKHYETVSQHALDKTIGDDVYGTAKRRLACAVQQFPFAFEDLVKLVDTITYVFKLRGLSFQPNSLIKKDYEIIIKRLHGASRSDSPNMADQFKAMGLGQFEEQFLFLSTNEMSELLSEVILSEHFWLLHRQQLATVNSKLVLFIANQYKGNFMDFEDLVQEGHTGLLKAVDRFKYRLGFQFSTYAGYWIRQAISRSLSRSERVVRIPCGQIATINKVFRTKDAIMLKTGNEPSTKELAEQTQLSQDEVNTLLSISQSAVSLEAFDDEDEQAFAPINFIAQNIFPHSYTMIAESQLHGLVDSAIKTLNPREAKILCSHFGLGTDQQMTLQEIGAELNLTRERVRQIQVVALNKIKARYGDQLLSFL